MAHFVLVHGWNVPDGGARTVDRLAAGLVNRGHTVDTDQADYGYLTWHMFSMLARWALKATIVSRLRKAFRSADVIVTHSNGAHFAHLALGNTRPGLLPRLRPLILVHLSPALNRDTARPPAASEMHIFHTRNDSAVRLASWLPFHPWGRMGALGPSRPDYQTFTRDFTGTVQGHSDWFIDRHLGRIVDILHSEIAPAQD